MKKMTEQLSSMHLTAWTLVALILWFTWGIFLASSAELSEGFRQMNSILVREWLLSDKTESSLLKTWFIGLCVLMLLLGINLVFCSWNKILRIMRVRFNRPKLFMLIVHVVFGLVALGHFGGFMLGYRQDRIRLGEGDKIAIGNGYDIEVTRIHFVDSPEILKKSRRDLMHHEFHYRSNYAEIILRSEGIEILRDRVFVLKPLTYKDMQLTLKGFAPLRRQKAKNTGGPEPAVMMAISRNPVLNIFLALYPLMIAGILIHLVITWRSPYGAKSSASIKKREVIGFDGLREGPVNINKQGRKHT